MTTEVLRNMIYARSRALTTSPSSCSTRSTSSRTPTAVRCGRRSSSTCPPEVRLVCLSATVSNADELAAWITTVRGETIAVVEHKRPVRLENLLPRRRPDGERLHLLPTIVGSRPNPEAFRLDREAMRRWLGATSRVSAGASCTRRPARGRRAARSREHAAGDLLHLQPQPLLRGGEGVPGRGREADDRRRARPHPRDRRRATRRDGGQRPRRARLRPVPRAARGRDRRSPRRHGAAVQGGRRGLLHGGPRQGGVRHRDVGGRHQHAGADAW